MAFNNLEVSVSELTGQVVLNAGSTSVVVNLPVTLPSNNYKVFLTPEINILSLVVISKTTTSFTIISAIPPTSDTPINWLIKF